jgi:hypothetical protein
MGSRLIFSTMPRFMTSEVTSRTVQRARPSGGASQTMARMETACLTSMAFFRFGREGSKRAEGRRPFWNLRLMRYTDISVKPTIPAITEGELPLSKAERTCARLITLTGASPLCKRRSNWARSEGVRWIPDEWARAVFIPTKNDFILPLSILVWKSED